VLDYDPAAARIRTHSADAIAKAIHADWLRVEWILETHVRPSFRRGLFKEKARRRARHWFECAAVQQILGDLFNDKPAIRRCRSICAPANCRRLSRTPPLFQDPDRGFNTLILSDPLPIMWVLLADRRSRARSLS
jgi:hypothetical protein